MGNNQVVVNTSGAAIQPNQYYPFGLSFADDWNQDKRSYKYNGKELSDMHGLNLYDYSARHLDNATIRFTSVDPLAEKYYSISPYAYVMNNPMKFIDPTGKEKLIYFKKNSVDEKLSQYYPDDKNIHIFTHSNNNKLLLNP